MKNTKAMKRLILLLLMMINAIVFLRSQTLDGTREFNIIPPSPEVSSLMNFTETLISPFTGQPDINVPIYTIKEGSLSVPISIRYHSSGIRINERSTLIGSGWNLNVGGCISRTIYGLADDMTTSNDFKGLFYIDPYTKAMRDSIMSRNTNIDYTVDYIYGSHILSYQLCNKFNNGLRDVANDIFHFNFMDYDGTFIYEPYTRHIILSTPSPIKFETMSNLSQVLPTEYKIFDNKGSQFIFGTEENIEYTTTYHRVPNSMNEFADSVKVKTAWHLDKIISITGDTIDFTYISGKRQEVSIGITQYHYVTDATHHEEGTSNLKALYEPRLISEIKSHSVTVKFNYSELKDSLLSIDVLRNKGTDCLYQRYKFHYSLIDIASSRKTLLRGVDRIGTDGQKSIKLYRFDYQGGFQSNQNAYYAIDHWGYFNGSNNSTLLSDYNSNSLGNVVFGNRNPHEIWSKCGILKSIKYPTGGVTNFTWEPNQYSYIKHIRLSPYTTRDTTISTMQISGKNKNVTIVAVDQLPDVERTITVAYATRLEIDMSRYIGDGMADAMNWDGYTQEHNKLGNSIGYPNYPRFEIRRSDNSLVDYWYIDSEECPIKKNVTLTQGSYILRLCNPVGFYGATINSINGFFGNGADNGGDFGYIAIKQTVISETEHKNYSKLWGGHRISKISSSAIDAQTVTKEYHYNEGAFTSLYSSGTITEEPYYMSSSYKAETQPILPNTNFYDFCYKTIGYHSNGLYSTPNGGSHVEYSDVWETYTGDNLIVRYQYETQRTYGDEIRSTIYDYIPGGSRINTSKSHMRGNLLRKSYYKGSKIYKTEEYGYRILENENVPDFCGDFFRVMNADRLMHNTSTGEPVSSDYTTCIYKLFPFNKGISNITTSEYINGTYDIGLEEIPDYRDTISYTYFNEGYNDSPMSSSIRSMSSRNSKGKIETTYYSYRYVSGYGYLEIPETEVTTCDGKIIRGKRMEYDENNRLKTIYRMPSGNIVEGAFKLGQGYRAQQILLDKINIPEYTFRYDENGNIIEIVYEGIPVASYLWSYQGDHPVAEIKGIGYDEMVAQLPSNLEPSSLSERNDVTEAELNTLRTIFPDAEVITITYHWLVGAVSLTNSRGVVTRYGYDGFGRLNQVKDYNNYFIRQYRYNYVN